MQNAREIPKPRVSIQYMHFLGLCLVNIFATAMTNYCVWMQVSSSAGSNSMGAEVRGRGMLGSFSVIQPAGNCLAKHNNLGSPYMAETYYPHCLGKSNKDAAHL
jgi:hypothetical protein